MQDEIGKYLTSMRSPVNVPAMDFALTSPAIEYVDNYKCHLDNEISKSSDKFKSYKTSQYENEK